MSKWIKYPLIVLLALFIFSVIFLIGYIGVITILNKEKTFFWLGVILIIFDIIMIVGCIRKVKLMKKERDLL